MLKTRVFVATDNSSDYRDWDSFSDEEREEMKLQLQIQFLNSIGAKNIKIKERVK